MVSVVALLAGVTACTNSSERAPRSSATTEAPTGSGSSTGTGSPIAAAATGTVAPAAAIGSAPAVILPSGDNDTVRVTPIAEATNSSNDLLWGIDRQVGPAYDFAVGREPSSATVVFPVDPGKLPAAVGVPHASPAGLFIQVYEPALGTWVPLLSTFDPVRRQVSAVGPHLSWYSLSWSDVQCALTCPAEAFAKLAAHFADSVARNFTQAWSPTQEHDDCKSNAATAWAVQSTIKKLSGCVIDTGGAPVVQIENPLLLPIIVRQPPGAPRAAAAMQPYVVNKNPELTSLVTELIAWASNATVVAPRSFAVLPVQPLSGVGTLTMATQPDALALVMDVVLSLLVALPGVKSEEEAVAAGIEHVLPEFVAKLAADGHFSVEEFLTAVEQDEIKQRKVAKGPVLDFAGALKSAYDCADSNLAKDVMDRVHQDGVGSAALEAAANLAKRCVETVLKDLGKEPNQSLKAMLTVLDGIPNFGKTLREGVQFAELGPSATLATTTAQRVPHDLSSSPYFQTPDGNIRCGLPNFAWTADTRTVPATARNELECLVGPHTVAPTACTTLGFEAQPAVSMNPGQYAEFTCVGSEGLKPMTLLYDAHSGAYTGRRLPYQASSDENVKIGPVTCYVQASSVDCAGNSPDDKSFHLDAGKFSSPLREGDSVQAAEVTGDPNGVYASSGTVRPAKYSIGADNGLSEIQWTEWTSGLAIGSGTFTYNTCQPTCADANYRTDKKVTVTFTEPKIICGRWFFTKLTTEDLDNNHASGDFHIAPTVYSQNDTEPCLPASDG